MYKYHSKALYFLTRGTIYDSGARLQKELISSVHKIIAKHKVANIIGSGAPFSFLYHITKIKNQTKSINFIADLRDPWTWGGGYGMKTLSPKRLKFEQAQEQLVLENANYITSASQDLKKVLDHKLAPQNKESILLINGVESNRLAQDDDLVANEQPSSSKQLIITHIGTASNDSEKYWKPLFEHIESSALNYKLNFYGNSNLLITDWVSTHQPKKIHLMQRVNEVNIQSILKKSNYLLFFKNDLFPDSFPSKFFDYIKSSRPLLLYTKKGTVSNEVITNQIGLVFDQNYNYANFNKDLTCFQFNSNYDWSKFSIEKLVKTIENLLV